MADAPMRFCASTGSCGSQVSLGPSNRVKIAKDRAATDDKKVDALREFVASQIRGADYNRFEDLLDDILDDAERTNPTVGQDGKNPLQLRQTRRLARQSRIRTAQDARPTIAQDKRPPASTDAAERARMAAIFPHMSRI
ncbi:hypothetical protein [Methylobacterium sp. J-070]|uniref:hypothetical protein n=1 Tax=Methylobacterium sp. J-070 TaxID=2836650 RepID=UPI001FB9421D|nr:hypothetical protein [Methylobacterium sp. J-070]MCJ2053698.1 hypothetical protein [Methylobacterium sp. J-070]